MTESRKPGQVAPLGIQNDGVPLLALTANIGEMLREPGKMHRGALCVDQLSRGSYRCMDLEEASYMRRQSWPIARRAMHESTFAGDS